MVGEIRDEETAQNAVQAALTGHLVFSTLHTNDSATSVTRLIDLGIQPFLISSTLVGTMAQRLMRRICEDCKRNRPLSVEEAGMLNLQAPPGKRIIVKEGAGCIRCRNTGYFGRTGIFEILPIDNAIRDLIDRSEDFLKIKEMAVKRGMRTLRQSALRKLAEGVTSFEEWCGLRGSDHRQRRSRGALASRRLARRRLAAEAVISNCMVSCASGGETPPSQPARRQRSVALTRHRGVNDRAMALGVNIVAPRVDRVASHRPSRSVRASPRDGGWPVSISIGTKRSWPRSPKLRIATI